MVVASRLPEEDQVRGNPFAGQSVGGTATTGPNPEGFAGTGASGGWSGPNLKTTPTSSQLIDEPGRAGINLGDTNDLVPVVKGNTLLGYRPKKAVEGQNDPALVQRMGALADNGHTWMPPQTMATIAAMNVPTDVMLQIAGSMRDQYVKIKQGWDTFYQDPVLQKSPSSGLAFQRYVSQALGPSPIQESDITAIQKDLQKKGFARDLAVDGIWNGGWQASYKQYIHEEIGNQLAGKQPGGVTVGSALHFLANVLPKEAGNAVIGAFVSTGHTARHLAADLAKASVGTLADVFTTAPWHSYGHYQNIVGGFVEGQTPEQYAHAQTVGRGVDELNALLFMHSAASVGTGLLKAAGVLGSSEATVQAASRGPGLIGQTLGRAWEAPGVKGVIARTGVGATAGTAVGLAKGALTGHLSGQELATYAGVGGAVGLLGGGEGATKLFTNTPVLKYVGPTIGKLLPEVDEAGNVVQGSEGLYYKTRQLLASPYKFTPVAVAGQAVSDLGRLGLQAHAQAGITQALGGGDQPFVRGVQDTHVLDTVDAALKRYPITILGHKVVASLDDIAWLLHGPVGHNYNAIGDQVKGVSDAFEEALGQPGTLAQIERGTGTSYKELVRDAGGSDRFLSHWSHNLELHAASHYAEDALHQLPDAERMQMSSEAYRDFMNAKVLEAFKNPDLLKNAYAEMLSNHGPNGTGELAARIDRQVTNARIAGDDGSLGSGKRLSDYIDASQLVKQHLVPLEDQIIGMVKDKTTEQMAKEVASALRLPFTADGSVDTSIIHDYDKVHFSVATHDYLTAHDARAAASDFAQRIKQFAAVDAAGKPYFDLSSPEGRQFYGEVAQFLWKEFGVQADHMPHDTAEQILEIDRLGRQQAQDARPLIAAHLANNPNPDLEDALTKLDAKGYKPIFGAHGIGLRFLRDSPVEMDGALTRRRQIAEALGLSPTVIPDLNVSVATRNAIRNELQTAVDKGKIRLPPLSNVDTLLDRLLENKPAPGRAERVAMELGGQPKKKELKLLASGIIASGRATTEADALTLAKEDARAEMNAALGLRDLSRKTFRTILTSPMNAGHPDFELAAQNAGLDAHEAEVLGQIPFLSSTKEADEVQRAVLRGQANVPAYMLGLSKIENIARAAYGFAGKPLPAAIFGGAVGATIGGLTGGERGAIEGGAAGAAGAAALLGTPLTNDLVRARDALRFKWSPYFSWRRVAKTNAKLWAENIAPTIDPLGRLLSGDKPAYETAMKKLDELMPGLANPAYDDATKALQQADIFGFYNARHYEAYAVSQMMAQGRTDSEMQAVLRKAFSYGTRDTQGRSALEKSINFVFFPFSFDKTLYRNFGGYLLDKPGQLMVLHRGLQAYKQFNDAHLDGSNPAAASWLQDHLPVLQEMERLNAFAHGVSLGEFGGINRPLFNLFLPQSVNIGTGAAGSKSASIIKRIIPAVSDLQRLYTEGYEQARIVTTAVQSNVLDRIFGSSYPAMLTGHPVAMSKQAQVHAAYLDALQAQNDFASDLDWNAHHPKDQHTWGQGMSPAEAVKAFGSVAGKPIDKTTINRLLAYKYPLFDWQKPQFIAEDKQTEVDNFASTVVGDPLFDRMLVFQKAAKAVHGMILDRKYTLAQAQQATNDLRNEAVFLAGKNPKFYKLYRDVYEGYFGPLEKVQ